MWRVLADDPATKNYGRVLLEVDEGANQRLRFKVLKAWLVKRTIQSAEVKTDISKVLNKYHRSFETQFIKHGPIHVYCAERFMPRGGGGCVQHGEAIAMMLTINVQTLQGTDCRLIPAVSWKTQIKRYFDLTDLYKAIKPCPEHLLDATLIGLYACYVKAGIKPYSTLKAKDLGHVISKLREVGARIKKKEDAIKAFIKADKKANPEKYPEPKKKKRRIKKK